MTTHFILALLKTFYLIILCFIIFYLMMFKEITVLKWIKNKTDCVKIITYNGQAKEFKE